MVQRRRRVWADSEEDHRVELVDPLLLETGTAGREIDNPPSELKV